MLSEGFWYGMILSIFFFIREFSGIKVEGVFIGVESQACFL